MPLALRSVFRLNYCNLQRPSRMSPPLVSPEAGLIQLKIHDDANHFESNHANLITAELGPLANNGVFLWFTMQSF